MDFSQYKKSLDNIGYYVYALCEIDREIRKPFYIGNGKGDRCLHHLFERTDSEKVNKIQQLLAEQKLGIDILRHGIQTDATAKLVEATCIDLLGVGKLSNKVRGSGTDMGRMIIEDIHNLQTGEKTEIAAEHQGSAFLLNSTCKSAMSEIELFEATRGVWWRTPRDGTIKFAYATYGGIIKEVYEIHGWVKAGTQQYFTRFFNDNGISNRWEFIGRKASSDVRQKYLGKLIKKGRSYGSPFVKVGY